MIHNGTRYCYLGINFASLHVQWSLWYFIFVLVPDTREESISVFIANVISLNKKKKKKKKIEKDRLVDILQLYDISILFTSCLIEHIIYYSRLLNFNNFKLYQFFVKMLHSLRKFIYFDSDRIFLPRVQYTIRVYRD